MSLLCNWDLSFNRATDTLGDFAVTVTLNVVQKRNAVCSRAANTLTAAWRSIDHKPLKFRSGALISIPFEANQVSIVARPLGNEHRSYALPRNKHRWIPLEECRGDDSDSWYEISAPDLNLSGLLDRIDLQAAVSVLPHG